MKTAAAVTLRPIGDARYLIVRHGDETGAWLFGTFWDWEVRRIPTDVATDREPVPEERRFKRVALARMWLDSDAGQRWLDQLPRAEGTP